MEGLIEHSRLLHGENALEMFELDEELIRELFVAYTTHEPTPNFPQPGMIGVIDGPGKTLQGSIALRLTQLYYSRHYLIEELWNFVHPEHRRSLNARGLIGYAKRMSEELSLPLLIGIVSNIRTEEKIRLYGKLLPKAGAFFVYRGDMPPAVEVKAA